MLPPFDAQGNLPSGDYWPDEATFEECFVSVRGSSSREKIYVGFKSHRVALLAAGVEDDSKCMLDGSYTTTKLDPEDIDLVVEVDGDCYLQSERLQALLSGPHSKPAFCCDAYPVLVFPEDHPHYEKATAEGRRYWHKWFGRDRANSPKGRVWATARGFR